MCRHVPPATRIRQSPLAVEVVTQRQPHPATADNDDVVDLHTFRLPAVSANGTDLRL